MTMRPHGGSLYRLVKRVIDEWDPVDLLSHAPPDEYDPEIREITRRMTPSQTPEELAESIERVFVEFFGEAHERTIEEFLVVAQRLLSSMSKTYHDDCVT
jgi:Domain of unknown function (DUF1871)